MNSRFLQLGLMVLGAIAVVITFRLYYALSVFTDESRRTLDVLTGIVDALIVFTNIDNRHFVNR